MLKRRSNYQFSFFYGKGTNVRLGGSTKLGWWHERDGKATKEQGDLGTGN